MSAIPEKIDAVKLCMYVCMHAHIPMPMYKVCVCVYAYV